MAYIGALMCLVALLGAWLYHRGRLERTRWFLWTGVVATAFPFVAATFGWLLTEVGRQPWIVQGLLRTSQANSPSVGTAAIAVSLGVFVLLYTALAVTDFVLIRRFARLDPPPVHAAVAPEEPAPVAAG
jgi:cytochrome d ubiquinol oxidase subunit I